MHRAAVRLKQARRMDVEAQLGLARLARLGWKAAHEGMKTVLHRGADEMVIEGESITFNGKVFGKYSGVSVPIAAVRGVDASGRLAFNYKNSYAEVRLV